MPPFLLGELHGDARMGLARLFGLCAALLFASSVNAANIIDLGPSDYRRWGEGTSHHHTNGLNRKFGQTIRMPPMNTNLTVTRNPVIPYGSIANGARNFLRINPASVAASAAITGLFLAVDWVFDQEAGEWRKEGELVPIPPDPNAYHWYVDGNPSGPIGSTPQEACEIHVGEWIPGSNIESYENIRYGGGATNGRCQVDVTYTNGQTYEGFNTGRVRRGGSLCPQGSTYDNEIQACVVPAGLAPLTQADWNYLESQLPALPASQVGDAAGDIQQRIGDPLPGYTDMQMEGPTSVTGSETTSTTVDPVTGDTIVTTNTTTTNISYGDQTITTTNTTTSTTYQNGQETSTTTTTETAGELSVSVGGGGGGVWPEFCEWAEVVCDWFDWTQEDPPSDPGLPEVVDDDFFEQKEISFGAKSCPPDHEINLAPFLSTTVGVSFQPLCDFAGLIYYMVMAASYIIAAYISIGVARNA